MITSFVILAEHVKSCPTACPYYLSVFNSSFLPAYNSMSELTEREPRPVPCSSIEIQFPIVICKFLHT